jgi:TolB-like protein/predicted Zn-dependent protease
VPGATALLLLAALCGWWYFSDRIEDGSPDLSAVVGAEAARAAQPGISIRAIEALGDGSAVTLLAQGITADLVTDLSKVSGLSVIAPLRSDAPADARMAVGAPAIRYVVSGSVQLADEGLRLHVRLTDAQTGTQLWSERFDRPLSGLFAMQEELVAGILQILPAKVSEAELRYVAQHHTRNLEAYEYFQRGQQALVVRQHAENETARAMFQRAIELDAAFARAYAGLALTYAAEHRNQWTRDGVAALDRAFKLARTANEINPDVRETYWVLAIVHLNRGEHRQALQHLETAIRLSPSFGDAYALMGGIYAYMGRPAVTLPLLRTAMRLNPEASYLYFLILGRAYFALGDLELARVNLAYALLRNPVNVEARVYMAAVYARMGNKAEAIWEAEEIRGLQPEFSASAWMATHPLTDAGVRAQLVKALGGVGL